MRLFALGMMLSLSFLAIPGAAHAASDPLLQPWAAAELASLRAQGPAGLAPLMKQYSALQAEIERRTAARSTPEELAPYNTALAELEQAIEQVAAQRYAYRSGLYWYTDFDAAVKAARAVGKPILSLRMLGELTEDYSCANSRFFRTTLYANAQVADYLREHFILHWESVRPVPRITIDFGDGRRLERTITGNSIHYVLSPGGEVVDALPGLYGPQAFLRGLEPARHVAGLLHANSADEFATVLREYHIQRKEELQRKWQADYLRVASDASNVGATRDAAQAALPPARSDATPPSAAEAARVARPKALIELPVLKSLPLPADSTLVADEALWRRIAALHAEDAQLDAASVALIRSQNPTAAAAGRIAITKSRVEDPLVRMLRGLSDAISLDTVRNEYQLHGRIHEWLASGERQDVRVLNERVYAELFLTPSSDPWLGLATPEAYVALPNAGVVQTK